MFMGSSERLMHVQLTPCVQKVISKCRSNFYNMNGFPKLSSDLLCRFYVAHLIAFFFFTFKLAMIENIEGKQEIGLPRVRKLFPILMLLQISLRFPNKLTLPVFLRN